MKTINNILKIVIAEAFLISSLSVIAQDDGRLHPVWWGGISGGGNFDYFSGTVQNLNGSKLPYAFNNGVGVAPYVSIFAEFRPDPVWGLMLNLALDNNRAMFNSNNSSAPAGVSTSVTTKFDYVSLEPSVRFAPSGGNFYLFAGPRVSYMDGQPSFVFRTSTNEENDQNKFTDAYPMRFSLQVGAGYDIPLSAPQNSVQVELSPFVALIPYVGLNNPTAGDENLEFSTVRAGIAIKFGYAEPRFPMAATTPLPEKDVQFSVQPPDVIPGPHIVMENLPLANHIFFDAGSTEIPDRYNTLTKDQAFGFREAQLLVCQKTPDTRSERQLKMYYNILNIIGDRMRKYPGSTVKLIGSSAGKGENIGKENADAVKNYLVNIFGIDESRITVEGRNYPVIRSEEYANSTVDNDLTSAEDNRVDVVSASPELVMESSDDSAMCLKPVAAMATDGSAPGDAPITVNANGAMGTLQYWSVNVKGQTGNVQTFGPFYEDLATISGKSVLGDNASGNYTIELTGLTIYGHPMTRETSFSLKQETEPVVQQDQVTSILFDFDKSKAGDTYASFLTNTVAPLIPSNSTVVIAGHTDTIGKPDYNTYLSMQRANETQAILENALAKEGKTGIIYQTTGYGENNALFPNALPEQRFYNRTVIINTIPSNNSVALH